MTPNSDGIGKALFDKLWPVATAALSAVASVSYTNIRLNSPETISVHPIAVALSKQGEDLDVSELKSVQDRTCYVDLEILKKRLNDQKPTDAEVIGFLDALIAARKDKLSKARYENAWSAGEDKKYSFIELERNNVLHTCQNNLNATLIGLGAAIVLSEKHDYLMSRRCNLAIPKQDKFEDELELPIRISVNTGVAASGKMYEVIPLKPPSLAISYTLDSPPVDALTDNVYQRYSKFISLLQQRLRTGEPLKAGIVCKVFFQDEAKHVGGEMGDAEVIRENS